MPTYNALGVTATLSVAPLDDTISEELNLRMGRLQRQEDERIKGVFEHGSKLKERAVGDGVPSIIHFVGEREDMALLVVQASSSSTVQPGSQQALCLNIDYCSKTFLRESGDRRRDLKFEVFLNGELVEVAYESARKATKPGFLHLAGTRIHRQSEKPWVYGIHESDMMTGVPEKRWSGIGEALTKEAELRGKDWANEPPITAQCLTALADMQLPEHIRAKGASLGVIDVLIIAGTGHRYGPDTIYRTAPTRMDDTQYSCFAALDLADLHEESEFHHVGPSMPAKQTPKNNDNMPSLTPRMSSTANTPTARTPQHQSVLEDSELRMRLKKYENAHGQIKGERTLRQRLGDMAKMSPERQAATLAELGEDLDEDNMHTIRQVLNMDTGMAMSPSPSPRKKSIHFSSVFKEELDPDAMDVDVSPYVSPYKTTPTIDPRNLTQEPDDLLFHNEPAKLAPSPSKTRITKASALANSPITLPPKPQTPKKRKVNNNSSSPIRDRAGIKRKASRWHPTEVTVEEALERFEIPDLCMGSSVGYSQGLEQRQVSKIRGGEFREETFVVGMRFIVL